MYRRVAVILLALFQAAWLNAILPGHRRGVVTVPGYEPSATHACCASDAGHDGPGDGSSNGDQKQRAAHCAVCAFAAKLSTPPALEAPVCSPRPVALAEVPPPDAAPSRPFVLTYHSRGPPLG